MTAYAKYDRFLSKKWYAYLNTTFEHDRFKDLELRSTVGAGTGYQVLDTTRTHLALESGLEYVHTDFYHSPTTENPALRLSTKFDHWLWPDAVQFFTNIEGYLSLENAANSFARTQTGFRFPLHAGLLATTQLNLDWDGNPAPGRESVDQTVVLGVGYQW